MTTTTTATTIIIIIIINYRHQGSKKLIPWHGTRQDLTIRFKSYRKHLASPSLVPASCHGWNSTWHAFFLMHYYVTQEKKLSHSMRISLAPYVWTTHR
jgi:hypothetical protein